MDAVRPADHGRVLEFPRAALEYVRQPAKIVEDDGGSRFELQCLGGIHNVIGSEPEMEPAGVRPNLLGNRSGKSDDVMADVCLHFADARKVEIGALADGLSG